MSHGLRTMWLWQKTWVWVSIGRGVMDPSTCSPLWRSLLKREMFTAAQWTTKRSRANRRPKYGVRAIYKEPMSWFKNNSIDSVTNEVPNAERIVTVKVHLLSSCSNIHILTLNSYPSYHQVSRRRLLSCPAWVRRSSVEWDWLWGCWESLLDSSSSLKQLQLQLRQTWPKT